jgi:hypothetical protein
MIQRINEAKGWFFEMINQVSKPLAINKREKTLINKMKRWKRVYYNRCQ